MTIRDQEAAEFAFAVRGYDRLQVDEYVARLREYAAEAEDRARASEGSAVELGEQIEVLTGRLEESGAREQELRQNVAEAGGENLPARLAQILELAREEAGDLRSAAERDSQRVRESASAHAVDLVEAARAEAESILADANEDEQAIRRQISSLSERKQSIVQELAVIGRLVAGAIEDHTVDGDHTGSPEPTRSLAAVASPAAGADGPPMLDMATPRN